VLCKGLVNSRWSGMATGGVRKFRGYQNGRLQIFCKSLLYEWLPVSKELLEVWLNGQCLYQAEFIFVVLSLASFTRGRYYMMLFMSVIKGCIEIPSGRSSKTLLSLIVSLGCQQDDIS